MHILIEQHREEIADLCRRFGVRRLEVFGSAARGADFDPATSDADFLVSFDETPEGVSWKRLSDLAEALERLLGRPADVLTRGAVERSRNYIRKRRILADARPVYG
jgi:predicted nucleotidyltransferase